MNIALSAFATIAAVLLVILAMASTKASLLERHFSLLIAINAVAVVALIGLVGMRLYALWREYQARIFGSRLKWRLLVMFILMAVMPGALIYAVSLQFSRRQVDSWFDVRLDRALEDGLALGQGVVDNYRQQLLVKAQTMGQEMALGMSLPQLNQLRAQANLSSAAIYAANGRVLAYSSGELDAHTGMGGDPPTEAQFQFARQHGGQTWVESGNIPGEMRIKALAPLRGLSLSGEPRFLQLAYRMPAEIVRNAESVAASYRDYQELQLSRAGLQRIFTLTLTFTLLLTLFAAIAFAFFLAERLARPLLMLAEGTQAVGAGDFTPRATVPSHDELGLLTHSFNVMTEQLRQARTETESNRQKLETTGAYLESVLANLSAGVLAFDADFFLRAANRGALSILQDDLLDKEHIALTNWPRHKHFAQTLWQKFQTGNERWQTQLEQTTPAGTPQALLIRGSRLPLDGGYVVVFDDITQLISAERIAAWGEVARRLAHEIKNPLTPIQLSAERLQHRLGHTLAPEDSKLLARATSTIVAQVEALKNMVNEFRDYARTPPPVLAAVDIGALLREVLTLYESAQRRFVLTLAENLPPVQADAGQLRQVLHNLIKNALEASPEAATISLCSRRLDEGRAEIVIADSGSGFSPQILARACEPYVTTKPKGTGLGLAIVKKIMDDHHGSLTLANREAGGATVTLTLPFAN